MFWADIEGQASRLSYDGAVLRTPPQNLGAIGNAHHVKLGEPWEHTIEPMFHHADDVMKYLVEYLLAQKPTAKPASKHSLIERMSPLELPDLEREQIGECVASLIVRSPAFRNVMRLTADSGRDGLPYDSNTDANNLIASNIAIEFRQIVRSLRTGGKMVLMFSDSSEFIFGEGFLHNLGGGAVGANSKFFVPMTPDLALGYIHPLAYRTHPNAVTVVLTSKEVVRCNEITQVYSKDYVYFRQQRPVLTPQFQSRQFLEYQYHQHPWLDELLKTAANFQSRNR